MPDGNRRVFELPGAGLKCGNCGAILPTVKRTTKTDGWIVRERICPECAQSNFTSERVIQYRERKRYASGNE